MNKLKIGRPAISLNFGAILVDFGAKSATNRARSVHF